MIVRRYLGKGTIIDEKTVSKKRDWLISGNGKWEGERKNERVWKGNRWQRVMNENNCMNQRKWGSTQREILLAESYSIIR